MKILVTYYTGTGNTEKLAKAIKDSINDHEVDLLPVKKTDPNSLKSYDLIFLGSGIYGFNVSRHITKLVKKAPELPSNFAYFYSHESIKNWPDSFESVDKILNNHNCQVLGVFDCAGENLVEKAQEQREALWSTKSPEEAKEMEELFLTKVKGHPDEEDLSNIKEFANSVINKL